MTDSQHAKGSDKTDMLVDMVRVLYDRVNMLENKLMMAEFRLSSVERWVLHEPLVIKHPAATGGSVSDMLDTVRAMSPGEMNSFAKFADVILREQ